MLEKFRAKVKENGHTFKWTWEKHFKDITTYQYFLSQVNGSAILRPNLENAIFKFMMKKEQ